MVQSDNTNYYENVSGNANSGNQSISRECWNPYTALSNGGNNNSENSMFSNGCMQIPPCQYEPIRTTERQSASLTQSGAGQEIDYTDTGGYKVEMNGSTVTVMNPDGSQYVKEWGDPHQDQNGTTTNWDSPQKTLTLPDGTQITMNAQAANTEIQSTSIKDQNNSISVDNTTNTITSADMTSQENTYNTYYQPQRNRWGGNEFNEFNFNFYNEPFGREMFNMNNWGGEYNPIMTPDYMGQNGPYTTENFGPNTNTNSNNNNETAPPGEEPYMLPNGNTIFIQQGTFGAANPEGG